MVLDIKFSNHAKLRMNERYITEKEVIQALTPPTKIISGKREKFIAVKNGVRMMYVLNEKKFVVITVARE